MTGLEVKLFEGKAALKSLLCREKGRVFAGRRRALFEEQTGFGQRSRAWAHNCKDISSVGYLS